MPYAERFSNPTRAFSPRQLPTDHDHAVPTREYQSDQSSRMLLGCRRPCCPKQNPRQAHQRERVPAPPPVDWRWGAGTVHAVQGSLRRAKQRRALDRCAPFRPDRSRDGRLRREHGTRPAAKEQKPTGLLPRRVGPTPNPVRPDGGLTRSLHIRARLEPCSLPAGPGNDWIENSGLVKWDARRLRGCRLGGPACRLQEPARRTLPRST